MEILQVEEVHNAANQNMNWKMMRVWALINCDLYESSGKKAGQISNGLYLIEFMYRNLRQPLTDFKTWRWYCKSSRHIPGHATATSEAPPPVAFNNKGQQVKL